MMNQGKDTPGVDQMLVLTPEERGRLCDQLSQLGDLKMVKRLNHHSISIIPTTTRETNRAVLF